jgi:hypothetical protein
VVGGDSTIATTGFDLDTDGESRAKFVREPVGAGGTGLEVEASGAGGTAVGGTVVGPVIACVGGFGSGFASA